MSQMTSDQFDYILMNAVSGELQCERDRLGCTREDLVMKMARPMPVATLRSYERGRRLIPLPRLVEICQALNVSPWDILQRALTKADVAVPPPTILVRVKVVLDPADLADPQVSR